MRCANFPVTQRSLDIEERDVEWEGGIKGGNPNLIYRPLAQNVTLPNKFNYYNYSKKCSSCHHASVVSTLWNCFFRVFTYSLHTPSTIDAKASLSSVWSCMKQVTTSNTSPFWVTRVTDGRLGRYLLP